MVSDRQQPPSPKVGVYGLIIGINIYKRPQIHPDLMGCVGDANSVLKYFTEDLNVPEENFLCLYDEKATREGILQGFVTHLIRNPAIRYHTPIVIYYAGKSIPYSDNIRAKITIFNIGHGDRMPAPSGWQAADNMVEMILPHDAGTMDANGQYVYGIPDLTLAFLLYSLSQAKGNNITVILDSCNSGSGTRSIEVRSRNSHDRYSPDIPNNLDAKLRRSLGVDYPTEIEHNLASKQPAGTLLAPSLDTHILLAACQEEELAQEIPNVDPETHELGNPPSKGVFTSTLLHELRKADLGYTSYTTLFRNMLSTHREFRPKLSQPLGRQTFQCEGRNQDRLLFSVQFSISKGKISLMPTSDKAVYRARVGSAQGVVPGTEFGVFTDRMDSKAPPLAMLVARSVGPTMSELFSIEPNNPQDIPGGAYATIIKYNDHSNGVRIWVDEGVRADEFWQRIITNLQPLPIFWADSKSPGHQDMEIVMFGEDIHVRGGHLTPGNLGNPHTLRRHYDEKRLVEMLCAIVYFHYHLKVKNNDAPLREKLGVTLRELKEKNNNWGSIIYESVGNDLFGESVSNGTVTIIHPDPDKIYGLELVNNSTENLYPYILYYDFEDYSVTCLYEPAGRTVKPPLPASKTLVIGYGSTGSQPFQVDFTNPRSIKEYGAFVLLVASQWVDIGYLQQGSPFENIPMDARGERRGSLDSIVWDNIIIRQTTHPLDIMDTRAPPAGPPPRYNFMQRVYRYNLRPVALTCSVLAWIWTLLWQVIDTAIRSFQSVAGDRATGFSRIVAFDITLGVLYSVACLIETFGFFAMLRQHTKLVGLYSWASVAGVAVVLAAEVIRIIIHFTLKVRQLHATAFGIPSRPPPLVRNRLGNGVAMPGAVALSVTLPGSLFPLLLDPTSVVSRYPRAPSERYGMGALPHHPQPYNPYAQQQYNPYSYGQPDPFARSDYAPPYDAQNRGTTKIPTAHAPRHEIVIPGCRLLSMARYQDFHRGPGTFLPRSTAWRTGCVMNDNDVCLAEFYFYTLGDKTVYNQQLNDLFVCYTLSRGLQKPCNSPRRPPLPLELILRIVRFAGFTDPKPDMNLTMDAVILAKTIAHGLSSDLYMTERLTRAQLASMARLQLIELPWDDSVSDYNKSIGYK
ncbi:caspase domain-containing protein [Rhizoctonia solani AG-1 IA]|uniref:Caspase domain-containing protein n=1 Tax=Thanatephorus cucumeris (strain AG1-IA) TaxID=983506 RepID=L8X1Q4_THACA|nr:caspase domain-containing protein [Rhizoctonia solani AG-1 IA]